MKTIFGFLSVTMLFAAIAVSSAAAQDTPAAAPAGDVCTEPAAEEKYTKFVELYNKKPATIPDKQTAIETGKQFVEKYGSCANWKEQVDFVNKQMPIQERILDGLIMAPLYERFDKGINTDNTEEIYAAGKEILAKKPDNLNIKVPLGVAGVREIAKKNMKFNDDTLRYANMALSEIKGGAKFIKKNPKGEEVVGALKYEYTRENVISELTYVIGYVTFYGKNDKKAGITHFYEALQLPGLHKDSPIVYNAIGEYYLESRAKLGLEIADLIKKLQAAPDAEKPAIDEQIKPKVALFKGYTERAMDALSRAHKAATAPALKTFKDSVYKTLQELYENRFEKKDGLNEWMATTVTKPLPNPTSAVTPVEDPEPTTTTTGVGAANGTGVGAANGTGVGAANGTGVGAASGKTVGGATKPAGSGSTTAKAKPKNRR